MKKTLITLFALGSVALGTTPTTYTVTFANGGSDTLTSSRSHLYFGEGAITLESWVLEFEITKLGDVGVFMNTAYGADHNVNNRDGLGIRTSTTSGLRLGIGGNDGSQSDDVLSVDSFHATTGTVSTTNPITLRLAYNAVNNTAYLVNVKTSDYITMETSEDYTLTSVATSVTGTGDVTGKTTFYTDGSKSNFKVLEVADMSVLANDSAAFFSYIVPEPTTATLSLLALCGLAARRRRK